jgi:endoglucanase Acf2
LNINNIRIIMGFNISFKYQQFKSLLKAAETSVKESLRNQQPERRSDPPPIPGNKPLQHPKMNSNNIFTPIQQGGIPINSCNDHPVPRHCVHSRNGHVHDPHCAPSGPAPQSPLQTNKFYANLLLGDQGCSVWTHPYSVCWAKGGGNARSWGLSISQIDREQLAFGPPTSTGASQYFISPTGELWLWRIILR